MYHNIIYCPPATANLRCFPLFLDTQFSPEISVKINTMSPKHLILPKSPLSRFASIAVFIFPWNIPPFIPTPHANILSNHPKPVLHPVLNPNPVVPKANFSFLESYSILNPKIPPKPSHKERNHN